MALVNPQIAMSYRPTTEYQPRNALAEYAQVQNILGAQTQQEVARMQMERMRQEDAEIERIHQIAMQHGGPENRLEMGKALFASRNPQQRELGYKIIQHEDAKRMFAEAENRFGYGPTGAAAPAAAAATTAAPAPGGDLVAAPIAPQTGVMREIAPGGAAGPETPLSYLKRQFGTPGAPAPAEGVNALPAAVGVSAPAAAPATNAMLAPSTAPVTGARVAPAAAPAAALTGLGGKTLAQLQQEQRTYSQLEQLGAPGAKGRLEEIKRELDFIYKTSEPGADQKLMRDLNIPLTEAGFTKLQRLKENPGELTRLLDRLDLPPADRRRIELQAVQKLTTHAPATSVTVTQEKSEAGEFGKLLVRGYEDVLKAANLAQTTLPSLDTQTRILNQGFTTGFGTDAKTAGASVLAALGVKNAEKFATNSQTFLAATQQAVLQKQLEQKGTQTAADAERITQTAAQRGNTVDANRFLIDVAREQLQRDIERKDFFLDWKERTGSFSGAETAWSRTEGNKSLFDRPALKKYLTPSAAEVDKRTQNLDKIFGGKR